MLERFLLRNSGFVLSRFLEIRPVNVGAWRGKWRTSMKQAVSFLLSIGLVSMSFPLFGAISGYLDMEGGVNRDAVTVNILNTATHSSDGSWTVTTPLTHLMVSTSFETPLLQPISIGGATFKDTLHRKTGCFPPKCSRHRWSAERSKPDLYLFLQIGRASCRERV